MTEKELEEFAKDVFKDEQLDAPSSNFDYLVMHKIQQESVQIVAKPVLSATKWIFVGVFVGALVFLGFYLDAIGYSSKYNFSSYFQNVDVNPTVVISLLIALTFIFIQIIFITKLNKKTSPNS